MARSTLTPELAERKQRVRAAIMRAVDIIIDVLVTDEPTLAAHAPDEVSSVRLPLDCRSADEFTKACREGRVQDARKVGRIWIASVDAWNARARGRAPTLSDEAKANARAKREAAKLAKTTTHERPANDVVETKPAAPAVSDALLDELGWARKRGARR